MASVRYKISHCKLILQGEQKIADSVIFRSQLLEINLRDKIFLQHLAKHRAPATSHSVDTPVPDYYGEKVFDFKTYRVWIRKQRKHLKKVGLK